MDVFNKIKNSVSNILKHDDQQINEGIRKLAGLDMLRSFVENSKKMTEDEKKQAIELISDEQKEVRGELILKSLEVGKDNARNIKNNQVKDFLQEIGTFKDWKKLSESEIDVKISQVEKQKELVANSETLPEIQKLEIYKLLVDKEGELNSYKMALILNVDKKTKKTLKQHGVDVKNIEKAESLLSRGKNEELEEAIGIKDPEVEELLQKYQNRVEIEKLMSKGGASESESQPGNN